MCELVDTCHLVCTCKGSVTFGVVSIGTLELANFVLGEYDCSSYDLDNGVDNVASRNCDVYEKEEKNTSALVCWLIGSVYNRHYLP